MENKYEHMTDEAVVDHIRQGCKDGTAHILNKYKNMVKKKARGLYLIGGESEDLIQEGMIGLFEAIQTYDKTREMSFHSFADLCVTRQLYTAVKASQRKKHGPLNSYVSLYAEMVRDNEDHEVQLANVLPAQKSAEDLFMDKENTELIEKEIIGQLSKFEREVLSLYLAGIGYTQIADILGKGQKSIDNALQRIKNKTKKCITGGNI